MLDHTIFDQLVGYLNIFAGILLTASLISFFGGLGGWFTRLGLESRATGLSYMELGVKLLFWLVVLLFGVQVIQTRHAWVMIAAGGVLLYVVYYLIREMGKDNKWW